MLIPTSKLMIGTVQLGQAYGVNNTTGKPSYSLAQKIISLAQKAGINHLDTAQCYGDSEYRLGKIGIADFLTCTKIPMKPENINYKSHIDNSVASSIKNLCLEHIDTLLLHDAEALIDSQSDECYAAMFKYKENQLVKKIGVSVYSPEQAYKIIEKYDIDVIQAPLNLFDKRVIDSGLHSYLREKNIELHVRSVFLQGLLLFKPYQYPDYFRRWEKIFSQFYSWTQDHKVSAYEACLSYVSSIKEINKIIVGIETVGQLRMLISFCKNGEKLDFSNFPSCSDLALILPSMWRL